MITDADIGQNVQRYRYLRGFSQAELAALVDLDRSGVSRIESGQRALTASELVRFAQALDTTPPTLLQARPSVPNSLEQARVLMRATLVTPEDHGQIGWFAVLVGAVDRTSVIGSLLPQRIMALPVLQRAEMAAAYARRAAGLTDDEPVTSPSTIGGNLGVPVCGARFPSSSRVSGCLVQVEDSTAVLVNTNHARTRQRFTVAHEIGHFVLDHTVTAHACAAAVSGRAGPRNIPELSADIFASALLLPRRPVREAFRDGITFESIHEVSSRFGVSHAAMISRLYGLGLVNQSESRSLRRFIAPRPGTLSTPSPYRIVAESLARRINGTDAGELLVHCLVVSDDKVVR